MFPEIHFRSCVKNRMRGQEPGIDVDRARTRRLVGCGKK
jgi:hypothetical protein